MANNKKIDIVILGLLSHEPLTGYEIKKRIDGSLSFFWSGSYGSIYPTLAWLTEEKLVSALADDSSARGKIRYTITEAGKKQLMTWLTEPAMEDRLHCETLLKVFFGGAGNAEITKEHILRFKEKAASSLKVLKGFEKTLLDAQDNYDHLSYLLTVRFGIETYTGYIRWCDNAIATLL